MLTVIGPSSEGKFASNSAFSVQAGSCSTSAPKAFRHSENSDGVSKDKGSKTALFGNGKPRKKNGQKQERHSCAQN